MSRTLLLLVSALALLVTAKSQPLNAGNGPGSTVMVMFKVYDADQKPVAEVNRTIPKHTNAFDALRRTLAVEFDTYPGLGNFLTSIAGIRQSPVENVYWVIYVDGSPSQLGISNFYIERNALIEFKLEKIQPSLREGQKIAVHATVADNKGNVVHKRTLEYSLPRKLHFR